MTTVSLAYKIAQVNGARNMWSGNFILKLQIVLILTFVPNNKYLFA